MTIRLRGVVGAAVAGIALLLAVPALAADQPPQPANGPGGTDYVSQEVVKRALGSFENPMLVFHAPGEPSAPRPVVIFLHAWGAANPMFYGHWIDHLARKGNLVLWPRMQDVGRTRIQDGVDNAVAALRAAWPELEADAQARPDPTRIATVGHLAGAPIAANIAARAAEAGIPAPKLVFLVMPGGITSDPKGRGIALADLTKIDPGTLMVSMIGDREYLPSDRTARQILREATAVPANRKLFMRVASDDHGFPALSATLAAPGSPKADYDIAAIKLPPEPPRDPKAPRQPRPRWSADMVLTGPQTILTQQIGNNPRDALDYLALWRTFDILMGAAFAGQDAQGLRSNPQLVDMGRWSNGWPMRRLAAEIPKLDPPAPRAQPVAAPSPVPAARPLRPRPSRSQQSGPQRITP